MHHFATFGGEDHRVGQTLANQLQAHQTIVDIGVRRSRELDQVHLHPVWREIFLERCDQFFGLLMIEGAEEEVHADNAERFLLIDV